MHQKMKFCEKPLPLKTNFRGLIFRWKFSILEHRLNKLCNETAIKLYLQNLEQEISKMAINNTKCKPSVNWFNEFIVLTAAFDV